MQSKSGKVDFFTATDERYPDVCNRWAETAKRVSNTCLSSEATFDLFPVNCRLIRPRVVYLSVMIDRPPGRQLTLFSVIVFLSPNVQDPA